MATSGTSSPLKSVPGVRAWQGGDRPGLHRARMIFFHHPRTSRRHGMDSSQNSRWILGHLEVEERRVLPLHDKCLKYFRLCEKLLLT